ncbi:hypothetical protein [Butyricicoccus sp. Marseille-Q5471]|uniref:hypothetical protein n=1 Tax=Butyricicoccus sp. Marseille-Q5471 TaxID=3039493 RepID=UPI0024BC8DEA|nr:hypothetical protein [Butyricicoccus sp. Marseille-Q5471]
MVKGDTFPVHFIPGRPQPLAVGDCGKTCVRMRCDFTAILDVWQELAAQLRNPFSATHQSRKNTMFGLLIFLQLAALQGG